MSHPSALTIRGRGWGARLLENRSSFCAQTALCVLASLIFDTSATHGAILWSDLGSTLAHESQPALDLLSGAVRRGDTSSDTLYFKFRIDPLSDVSTEEYFAAFQLYEEGVERLGIGNSLKAWAYSAFNTAGSGEYNRVWGDIDLRSIQPEPAGTPGEPLPYELPRRGIERTIAFKVKYIPGADDQVTVWLNPDLRASATEETQDPALVTRFDADASFDEIRLRHAGGGRGWIFSGMTIGTEFNDLIGGGADALTSNGGSMETRVTVRSWQREQGLPQNEVRAIAQTTDGYLWLGSDEGITRFDGVRFVTFGTRDGLAAAPVRVLLADSEGALWIGSSGGGLSRLHQGSFTNWTTGGGLPAERITALAEDNHSQIWVGTEAGLALMRQSRVASFETAAAFRGKVVTALYRDPRGIMWVGIKDEGVFAFKEGEFVRLPDSGVETLLKDSHCLLEDRSGRFWVGAGDDFLLCRESDEWRRYRISRHLSRPHITALAEAPDGTVWAGSVSEGLFEVKAGKLNPLDVRVGLPDNFVECLAMDREGNLWVGTGAGLSRLRRSRLLVFGSDDSVSQGPVQGMAEIAPGVVWVCKAGDGLYRWDGKSFSRISSGLADDSAKVQTILAARNGSTWVAGENGVFEFRNALDPHPDTGSPSLPGKSVTALAEDSGGTLWAGTREGELWRHANGAWEHAARLDMPDMITALAAPERGGIWVGTENSGVLEWNGGWVRRIDKETGLLSETVRTLHLDGENALWIGTRGGGLARWLNGQLNSFTSREGLPDNTVLQIVDDRTGTLWLGTRRGIAGVAKRDLAGVADGRAAVVYPRIYGRTEGMASEECTTGFFPSGLRTRSGLIWFATVKGIVVVDPETQQHNPAPLVRIEEVVVDEESVDFREGAISGTDAQPLLIAPGKKRIEFRFTGISFAAPDRVRFRYRLEGLDPGWVEAGTRRTAFYGYLPPGEYRFQVIACNTAGVWNDVGATLPITVLRRFYQSAWFISISACAFVAAVAGSVRIAVKRKLQRRLRQLEQERAVARERERIAQDLHDELGSSLTRISLMSDLLAKEHRTNPEQAALHASKISQTSTQTVRALEQIVWALRPGSDTVQSLIEYIAHFAKELFDGDTAQCRLDLPESVPGLRLPPEMRHNIFLIVKEALTNAFKHAKAREVLVRATLARGGLEIVIADDGQGFDFARSNGASVRNGLKNMQRRAEAMGGTLTIAATPGQGTRVTITVQLASENESPSSTTASSNGHTSTHHG